MGKQTTLGERDGHVTKEVKGGRFIDWEEVAEVNGVYDGMEKTQFGESARIKVGDELYLCGALAVLSSKLKNVPIGKKVSIRLLGEIKTEAGKNPYKNFDVLTG
jgi:hypothetical protein